MKKEKKKKIILSFTVPLIYLLTELIFISLSKQTLRFDKPWFFLTLLIVLLFTPFIFRWEVKLLSDLLLYSSISIMTISNMYYLIKSGSSNVNIYDFSTQPYFTNNSSRLNILLMITVSVLGLISITLLDVLLRHQKIFVLEQSINSMRINLHKTPVFILFSSVILVLSYHLQVANNIKYDDFKSFVRSSNVSNNHGAFAYGLFNLVNQSAKIEQNNHLWKLGIEQKDDKGNTIALDNQNHYLYTPHNNNTPHKQNYLILNIPGLTYEPLKEITDNQKLTPFFSALTKILINSNVYNNFYNTNPCFISEQQLFLGHISSKPYFNSTLKTNLRYSLPALMKKENYETIYLTTNSKTDYNYEQIYRNLGYTNFLSSNHTASIELENISNQITKLEEKLADTINIINKNDIEKEIAKLKKELEFVKYITIRSGVHEINYNVLPTIVNAIKDFTKDNNRSFLLNTTLDLLNIDKISDENIDFIKFKKDFVEVNSDFSEVALKYFYGLYQLNSILSSIDTNSNVNKLTIILAGCPYDYSNKKLLTFLNNFKHNSNERKRQLLDNYSGNYCLVYYRKGEFLTGIGRPHNYTTTPYMVAPEILYNEGISYPTNLFHGVPLTQLDNSFPIHTSFIFSKFYNLYGYDGEWYDKRKALSIKDSNHIELLNKACFKQFLIDSYFAFGINTAESV